MKGWLYLIRNKDLYKIGITRNFDNRMRQLKPDKVVAKLYSSQFKQLEREFHNIYKKVRIPQSEYFRLDIYQVRDIKKRFRQYCYPMSFTLEIIFKSFSLLALFTVLVILIISLTINNINNVLFLSLLCMERISIVLSFLSLIIRSGKYFSFLNELKFRTTRLVSFSLFALAFRYLSRALF